MKASAAAEPARMTATESKIAVQYINKIERLETELKVVTKELKAASREQAETAAIKALIGPLCERASLLQAPRWLGADLKKASSPGVPTLFLSDLHWGEVVFPTQIGGVNKYNIKIANARLAHTVETAIHLLKILDRDMDYPGIVVPLGGDLVSGNLHDELTATNEFNSMPTVLDLYGALIGAIQRLADTFGAVFLPCVTGNHGRDTRKIWNKDRHATSFDWLICQLLAKHFEADKRVTFFIPDGNDALYKVFGHRYLLTHGDKLGNGGDGIIGMLGPVIRGDHKKRSRNAQIGREYDTLICGHFHQYTHMTRVVVNGSLKGMDEYAYIGNFPWEAPQQALWVTHPRHGPTFRMPIYCEAGSEASKGLKWVTVPSR